MVEATKTTVPRRKCVADGLSEAVCHLQRTMAASGERCNLAFFLQHLIVQYVRDEELAQILEAVKEKTARIQGEAVTIRP